MPVNGALRFAWIWIPVLAFLFGALPITEQAVSEWDSEILKATSAEPSPPREKGVDEWDGEVIKSTSGDPAPVREEVIDEWESDVFR